MVKYCKRLKEIHRLIDREKVYTLKEAIGVLKKCPKPKFDESVEISLKTGVDPKKSDQQVRGTVALPHGTGKKIRVVVISKGDNLAAAQTAGADTVGGEDLIEKIKEGWVDFDSLIVTPDMMREVGKLGKVLGPRGLMPTPKAGTVTTDVAKAVREIKGGKVEFKVDKSGMINNMVGKISFDDQNLVENVEALLHAVARAKPPTAKGTYMKSLHLSSTMGPGLKIEITTQA